MNKNMTILVPAKCLRCGAKWIGGHEIPGKPMKFQARVFYRCGAQMSIKRWSEYGCDILFTNCQGGNDGKDT